MMEGKQATTTAAAATSNADETEKESNNGNDGLTKWTDDKIRWSDCEDSDDNDEDDSDDDEAAVIDPFKDPDPYQTFSFQFDSPYGVDTIDVTIKGYKADTDEVWKSTGVTLWRASEHLCDYMIKRFELFQNKKVLELGAGLGLNGILAHHLRSSHVYVTDGDINAVSHLRRNIQANKIMVQPPPPPPPQQQQQQQHNDEDGDDDEKDNQKISGEQLLWGKDTSETFLNELCHEEKFDIILASDIIYSPVIIPPLWETLHTLLKKPDGVLIMAFARREVKVTIEYVLETAIDSGFVYERVDKQDIDGIFIYEFRWKA